MGAYDSDGNVKISAVHISLNEACIQSCILNAESTQYCLHSSFENISAGFTQNKGIKENNHCFT